MNRPGRKLSAQEAELWARLAKTVVPISGDAPVTPPPAYGQLQRIQQPGPARRGDSPAYSAQPPAPRTTAISGEHGLDTGWDRKLARGLVDPDFTLDLHGCTLDAAHGRLMHGIVQAKGMGARLILLITGKPRPADPADRSSRRGAIRSKVIDWLAASEHALDIAAMRGAHRRHGGQGALYIILKRKR